MKLEFDWTVRQQIQTPRDFLTTKLSNGTKASRPRLSCVPVAQRPEQVQMQLQKINVVEAGRSN